ncbi:MAG: SRPBCC family protein [Vampirovibrio sp.]|nr:SRPBCC family protein [Vampirovibrio sp.]
MMIKMGFKRLTALTITATMMGVLMAPGLTSQAASPAGKVVSSAVTSAANVKKLNASVSIDAPPSYVWQTLTSYEQLQHFVPSYKKSRLKSNDGANKVLDIVLKVSRLLPSYNYQMKVHENRGAYQIDCNRVSGDFEYLKAKYKLYPKDNGRRTTLVYNLQINPGLSLPGVDRMLTSNTKDTLKAIQTHSEKKHRQSMIGKR